MKRGPAVHKVTTSKAHKCWPMVREGTLPGGKAVKASSHIVAE
jgi:hypothetical protein